MPHSVGLVQDESCIRINMLSYRLNFLSVKWTWQRKHLEQNAHYKNNNLNMQIKQM